MRKLILGAKYFIKDKKSGDIIEAQISQLNEEELSFIDLSLDSNNEVIENYREINDIEVIDIINEEDAKRLNNQDVFSVRTSLIKGILGRGEVVEFSENNFKQIDKDENTVLISITDPDRPELNKSIHSQFKDSISIQFWDVEEGIGKYVPINEIQAKEIRDFIIKNKENNFLIHCEAGMSRSAGVGLAVMCLVEHNGDAYSFSQFPNPIKEHHRYHPNWKVFDMIIGKE